MFVGTLALAGAGHGAGAGPALEPIDIVTENYPPFEIAEPLDGLPGFDVEVATEAFKRIGYRANIRFLPWKRALSEARNGSTAGILTCAHLPEREAFIHFSDPISTFTDGLFMRIGHRGPDIRRIEDVIGQPVASMAGYESLTELQRIGALPTEVPTTAIGLRMLAAGRFDYLHGAKEPTQYEISRANLSGQFEFIALDTQDFHFCFSNRHPGVEKLAKDFNAALAEIRADGTYDAIHGKYR